MKIATITLHAEIDTNNQSNKNKTKEQSPKMKQHFLSLPGYFPPPAVTNENQEVLNSGLT